MAQAASFRLAAFLLGLCLFSDATRADVERTELTPLPAADATLTIVSDPSFDGTVLTTNEIEALEAYSMITTTPWREAPALFEGVLLRDLLAEYGLERAPSITVQAENDYEVTIPRAIWTETDLMVATRVNGVRIPRRARGPILFMADAETYKKSDFLAESYLVWMVSRIAPSWMD